MQYAFGVYAAYAVWYPTFALDSALVHTLSVLCSFDPSLACVFQTRTLSLDSHSCYTLPCTQAQSPEPLGCTLALAAYARSPPSRLSPVLVCACSPLVCISCTPLCIRSFAHRPEAHTQRIRGRVHAGDAGQCQHSRATQARTLAARACAVNRKPPEKRGEMRVCNTPLAIQQA